MAKRNVFNRKMFVQKFANGGSAVQLYDLPETLNEAQGIRATPFTQFDEIIVYPDEGSLETSDYQNYYGIPRIIDRSKSQKGDYGRFKGLSPTFTRESSDYTQGDDRQVDDPEIIRRNIEKTMIPQGGDVTPQGGFPDMSAGRVPTTQGGIANIPFGQGRVPTSAVPVAIPGQVITSESIPPKGGIAGGTGNDMSGGTGGGTPPTPTPGA